MDEMALLQSARMGDLEAFNRLLLEYQDLAYHQAYSLLQDRDGAEDAAQEAFIRAFRSLKEYRGGSFKAWLLRIVTNTGYDELRRRKSHPIVSLTPVDADGNEIESPSWSIDPGPSPEDWVERNELRSAIQCNLAMLPPEYRSVITLIDVFDMDYSEAAQALGIPVGTVRSRLARARQRMRLRLNGKVIPAKMQCLPVAA
jgi:RNA polymerase sigma-70 factor (ECF subfamily)